jgi:hypothetical protein
VAAEHLRVALRRREIAGEQGDRASRLRECIGKRKRVVDGNRVFDVAFDVAQRLVRETLQPQDPR